MIQNEWTSCSLDELLIHVIGGDWGQDNDFFDAEYETVSCIRGSEFRNWRKDQGATAVPRKIKKSSLDTRNLRSGDVLIEISGGGPEQPVGRTVLITEQVLEQLPYPAICTNFLRLARPAKLFSSSYLNYFLTKFYLSGEVIKYQGGSNNLRNLKFKEFLTITVPCPSFAEQKEIAERLDKLLAQVAATQARLAHIPGIIKRFRQSVLAAAVSGKLTEEWRESNKLPLPKEVKLEQIICEGPQNGLYKAQKFYGEGVRIIRIDGFYDGEIIGWDKVKRLSLEDFEYSRWKLEVGDILVNRVNSIEYLGKSAIVRELPESAVFESNIMKFRVNPDEAIPEYIVKFLCSTTGLSELRKNAKLAVNQASINQQDVKNCQVYLPVPQEQTEIVRRVEQLFAYADTIEQQAKAAKERVDKLTQAILAKAFRGEFTLEWRAANPDLISGDNSAAALLARIQAERATAKPRKSRRG
ncbi:restriction endonuclease subunit S [Aeromonas bivalvium]|uniref:restriction endonuclease subunit S n=1 Tax=Aeromonas bivalvium TaxID=440079 RepID=UPI000A03692B|nr:restriction endonuclease subunit S [Aeromonas bivalvium]